MMIMLPFVVLGTIFAASFTAAVTHGSKAKILLELDDNKIYKLNEYFLEEISQLQRPIRVIAAVGNAKVGKSTTLNLISHIWDVRSKSDNVDEIFKTGDSFDAVTRNVWAHIVQTGDEKGSVVLLDVEGFNLGDDTITTQLSMFTAMISSCLNIFAENYLGNNDIDFLYQISRLSGLVFQNKTDLQNYPKLHIIVRSNLKRPTNETFESYIRNKVFRPDENKGNIVKRYFPRDSIAVSRVPNVNIDKDPKILQDLAKLRKSSHWNSFHNLMNELKNCPEKRIIEGSPVDGQALVELAYKVVRAMNENSWEDFGDVFLSMEKYICTRSHEKHIKPVLLLGWRKIEDMMMEAIEKFKEECFREIEIKSTKNELKNTLKDKRRQEEEEKRKQEEENNWWYSYATHFATALVTYAFFSDEHLKNNTTTLPYSQYNDIGLTGVCWTWNEIAQMNFGLTGEGCGVIAQEVQKLYPWAVLEGADGFLQVRYGLLHQMIVHARGKC